STAEVWLTSQTAATAGTTARARNAFRPIARTSVGARSAATAWAMRSESTAAPSWFWAGGRGWPPRVVRTGLRISTGRARPRRRGRWGVRARPPRPGPGRVGGGGRHAWSEPGSGYEPAGHVPAGRGGPQQTSPGGQLAAREGGRGGRGLRERGRERAHEGCRT